MKTLYKYLIVFPFRTLLLLLLVAGVLWTVGWIKPVSEIKTGGDKKVTITAEDVKQILEINGASQIVIVETDTAFTALDMVEYFGIHFAFLDTEEKHLLHEIRTWKIKAGCTQFELEQTDTATLIIGKPHITSREHMTEKYAVVDRVGVWNPVVLKSIEMQSRNEAVALAIKEGILTEARFSIENELRDKLPKPLKIRWK